MRHQGFAPLAAQEIENCIRLFVADLTKVVLRIKQLTLTMKGTHRYLMPLLGLSLLTGIGLSSGCKSSESGRDAWNQVLLKCADSADFPKRRQLYFGPSNAIGPGSVWGINPDGGFDLRFPLSNAIPSQVLRSKLIIKGENSTCSGSVLVSTQIKASFALSAVDNPLQADLSGALESAQTTRVSVDSWRVDRLANFDYEAWAKSKEADGYGQDLVGPKWRARRFMDAAIAVSGFSAELSFESKRAASLQAKYPNPTANIGGSFSATWVGTNTLKITSKGEFYISGSLSPVREPGSLGSMTASRQLVPAPIAISKTTKVGLDIFRP